MLYMRRAVTALFRGPRIPFSLLSWFLVSSASVRVVVGRNGSMVVVWGGGDRGGGLRLARISPGLPFPLRLSPAQACGILCVYSPPSFRTFAGGGAYARCEVEDCLLLLLC